MPLNTRVILWMQYQVHIPVFDYHQKSLKSDFGRLKVNCNWIQWRKNNIVPTHFQGATFSKSHSNQSMSLFYFSGEE